MLPGVSLEILPAMNVSEDSMMNSQLCVQLSDVGDGLERSVHVNFKFVERDQFATSGKSSRQTL